MNKTIIAGALSALLAGPVFAGTVFDDDGNKVDTCQGSTCGPVDSNGGAGGQGGAGGNASATANGFGGIGIGGHATANGGNARAYGGSAYQGQGQLQGQSQGQSLNSRNSNDTDVSVRTKSSNHNDNVNLQGNKQSVGQSMTYNEADGVRYSGSYTVKSAPSMGASNVQPTAGCRKPFNASGSGIGFGFSVGTTFLDETCVLYTDVYYGLQGDDDNRKLANYVIRNRLLGHLVDEMPEEEGAGSGSATTSDWPLPNYDN